MTCTKNKNKKPQTLTTQERKQTELLNGERLEQTLNQVRYKKAMWHMKRC